MNSTKSAGLIGALLLSGTAHALDWSQDFSDWEIRPRVTTGMMQYTYEQETGAVLFDSETSSSSAVTGDDVKDTLLFAEMGVSVFFGNFFADFSFQKSNEGEDDYKQDVFTAGQFENGDPFIVQYTESAQSKFEREEFSLSFGYAVTDRTGIFVGYREHETTFDDSGMRVGTQAELGGLFNIDSIIRRDSTFEQDGFFLGATYVWPYESDGWLNGALSVDLGVAFLDGKRTNTEVEDFIEFDNPRTEKFSLSGDGVGFNLGIAWSGPLPLGDRLNYSIGLDGYQYNYEGSKDASNFEDTLFRFTLGVSYAIDARGIF